MSAASEFVGLLAGQCVVSAVTCQNIRMRPRELTKVVALVNAQAGAPGAQAQIEARITAAFAQHGISTRVEVHPADCLTRRVHELLDDIRCRRVDAIVAGGGDGTIRSIAAVLAETGAPLGILPLGTLNHLAKDIGIPLELDAAVAVIAATHSRAIDVGEVNGSIFVNNSSIGIYPYMVLDRERRRRKSGLKKWMAMLVAAVRTLHHFPIRRLRVCLKDRVEPYRTPCLFIGNNEYRLDAASFGDRIKLDEGVLWLCLAKSVGRLSLIWLAIRSMLGFLKPQDLRTLRIDEVAITTRTSRLMVALDGEVQIMRPPLHYRIRPGALMVYAPPG